MKRRNVIGGLWRRPARRWPAGLYRFTDLFVKHYPPTPYDDVLAQLVDRAAGGAVGRHGARTRRTPQHAGGAAARRAEARRSGTARPRPMPRRAG